MKRCSICHATFPAAFTHCPHDGSLLLEANEWSDGAVIRGKYRILGKLGQGGMATVYKALHLGFDELRALKVIHPELASDPSFVKRFGHEAALTRKLQHPNAVRVEDIDQAEDGRPFMVMEFIEGDSLQNVIQKQAPLRVARVCRIAKQVAAALDAAHGLGMIHRDVKPGNILLASSARGGDEGEVAKVLDFGIAKMKEMPLAGGATLTRTGTSIGTPAYMSPEQAMGKTGAGLDARSDLYSLGVVIYEMLTGGLPIQAETDVQMLIGQIHTPPQTIQGRPEVPEALVAVVMRCLEKDPGKRPSSGAELIRQIEFAEKGMRARSMADEAPTVATVRPTARASESVPKAPRQFRARWVGALMVVPFAAFAIAGAAFYFGSHHKRRPSSEPPSSHGPAQTRAIPEAAPAVVPPAAPVPAQPPPFVPQTEERPASRQSDADSKSNPGDGLQNALNAIPFDAATKKQIKDVWRQAGDLMKKGDFDGAAAQYRKLTQLRPGLGPDVAALTALAAQASHAGNLKNGRTHELAAAVAHYSMEAGIHPEVASNHLKLGLALGKIGDLDGDAREQREALRLDSNLAAAHAELGSVYAHKEAWNDAAREYREAIRLKSNLPETHSGLGDALGHTGDAEGEMAEERIAIQQQPGLAIAHFRLGTALEHEGETADALREYRRAAELDPSEAEFRANYHRLLSDKDDQ